MSVEVVDADLVVLGTGVAGLTAALGAEGQTTHLLTKIGLESGSSIWAQGGVAAAIGHGDSPELHAEDTVAAGAGLVDPEVADIVARDGVLAVRRLIEIGAEFDRGERGELALGQEAAHSRRRVLHARGDATGAELVRTLADRVRASGRIELHDRTLAQRIVVDGGAVAGVVARHGDGRTILHRTSRVVLATGGLGQLYRYTTNPVESTGDGVLLASEAGARMIDLEFVQFHPTALAIEADPLPLLTEALRGEGATLIDERGGRFMPSEHADAELAPRDIVARAIWRRLAGGGRVFLDARRSPGDRIGSRFPSVAEICRRAGFDPRTDLLPVVPAAHYFMGGVEADRHGRSSLSGLWICGEIASTGAHGANRLASNSLLEALVFGARVATSAGSAASRPHPRGLRIATADCRPPDDSGLRPELRNLAWQELGLVRDGAGLAAAGERLDRIWRKLPGTACEIRSMTCAARLIAAAAERRTESRGAHYRSDHPEARDEWRRRQTLTAEVTQEAIAIRFEDAPGELPR